MGTTGANRPKTKAKTKKTTKNDKPKSKDPRAANGVTFDKDYQPPPENKSAGWAKKRFSRNVIKEMLDMKVNLEGFPLLRDLLIQQYGPEIVARGVTWGEAMAYRQMAITTEAKADTQSFKEVLNQAFGMPKQEVENTGESQTVLTIKRGK